jgi:hypothetical protein
MNDAGIVYLDETARGCRRTGARRVNGLGILGCLFSLLGVVTFGLFSPVGLVLSMLAMGKRPRFAATIGTVLGGLGTAFLVMIGWAVLAGVQTVNHQIKADQTADSFASAVAAVEEYQVRNQGRLPEGIEGNKLLITRKLNDAWGGELRYDVMPPRGYLIRSAGPDRQFDTADDLTRP